MDLLRRLAARWSTAARWAVGGALVLLTVLDAVLASSFATSGTIVAVLAADAVVGVALLADRPLPRRASWALAACGGGTLAVWLLGTGSPGLAEGAAMLGLLLLTARYERPLLVAALAVVLVLSPTRLGPDAGAVTVVLLWALGAAGAIGTGAFLRSLDDGRRRAEGAVREAERRSLAQDLHDFVAHHVTGIVVQAQAARVVAAQDPSRVDPLLEGIERAGAEAMTSMRRLVGVLRDDDPTTRPTVGLADLDELARTFGEGGRPRVVLDVAPEVAAASLPPEVATTVHRVVLESLTNVRRHAPRATAVTVAVRGGIEGVEVRVRDDGPRAGAADGGGLRGLGAGLSGGLGLVGLRERVEAVGGWFAAGPAPDTGWEVRAVLPGGAREVRA